MATKERARSPRRPLSSQSSQSSAAGSRRKGKAGRSRLAAVLVPALLATLIAAVGSVAAVTLSGHQTPTRYIRVPVGSGGTDGSATSATGATGTGAANAAAGSADTGQAVEQQAAPSTTTRRTVPVALPAVAPMRNRADPDLFLIAPAGITAAQLARLRSATGAIDVLQFDAAPVTLGKGVTTAVGVDPSTFRNYAPENTASVDGLWQRVKSGDIAVAHAVGSALQVKLGQSTPVGNGVQVPERIGAFATSRLPGVGVIADKSLSSKLRLVPGAALAIRLPAGADTVVATASATQAIPKADVQALRYSVTNGSTSTAVVRGGVPIIGKGWTLPLRLGTFTFSQRFGHGGHPGIDLAAPLETPIYAASEGDVLYWGPAQGFGNWIVLQHPNGVQTVYGHMKYQDLLVPPTAHVKAGQNIARVGSEGFSTGPHLHFEVHIDGARTDPVLFLNAQGVTQISNAGLPG